MLQPAASIALGMCTNFVLHCIRAMRNVTIRIDEDVLRWARVRAAETDTSVSRLVAEMLREKMSKEENYQKAMETYFSLPPLNLRRKGEKLPKREELYDRQGLR